MKRPTGSRIVIGSSAVAVVVALVVVANPRVTAQGQGDSFFDFSGEYAPRYHEDQPERIPGLPPGDYLGYPINDAARKYADSFDASLLSLPEHQCKPHASDYSSRGPALLRIWKEMDSSSQQLIAFHTLISWQTPQRTIWMDGRPHPPDYAPLTWQGFSTGRFEGDTLRITTTHLKLGMLTRNQIPRSDTGTMTEYLARHGDVLTLTTIVYDPVYLTEPFIRTTNWVANPRQRIPPYPCDVADEIVDRPRGYVPHHLPGANPYLQDAAKMYGIPFEATRGGAATMYPEYVLRLQTMSPPASSR
jgi:hypothetical protein